MRQVIPFTDRFELQQAIDNGGRFYNLFSKAGDSVVTKGELAKAAGVCGADVRAILFLEFAKWELDPYDQTWILDLLEPKLRDRYESFQLKHWMPSQVAMEGAAGSAAITTGYPRFLKDQTQFNGFMMIPISTGTVTTFTMVPLYKNFDLYEVFDDESMQSANCLIAVEKDLLFDQNGPIRFGGILRELKTKEDEPSHPFFLETYYYTSSTSGKH